MPGLRCRSSSSTPATIASSHSSFQQLVVAGRLGVAGEELSGGHLLRYVCNSFRPRAAEDVIGSLDPALEVLAASRKRWMAFLATSDPPAPFGDEARMEPFWPGRTFCGSRSYEVDSTS